MNNQTKEVSPTENYPGTQNPGQSSKLVQEYKRKYIEGSNPFLHAGIISRTFYGWMNPILRVKENLLVVEVEFLKKFKFKFSEKFTHFVL